MALSSEHITVGVIMTTLHLQNRDVHNRILEYDKCSGPIAEHHLDSIPPESLSELGCYISVNDEIYGIYASSNGPVFFSPVGEIELKSKEVKCRVENGESTNRFVCSVDKNDIINLRYKRWENVNVDPWSGEDFVDFFVWFSKTYNSPGFLRQWSVASPPNGASES